MESLLAISELRQPCTTSCTISFSRSVVGDSSPCCSQLGLLEKTFFTSVIRSPVLRIALNHGDASLLQSHAFHIWKKYGKKTQVSVKSRTCQNLDSLPGVGFPRQRF